VLVHLSVAAITFVCTFAFFGYKVPHSLFLCSVIGIIAAVDCLRWALLLGLLISNQAPGIIQVSLFATLSLHAFTCIPAGSAQQLPTVNIIRFAPHVAMHNQPAASLPSNAQHSRYRVCTLIHRTAPWPTHSLQGSASYHHDALMASGMAVTATPLLATALCTVQFHMVATQSLICAFCTAAHCANVFSRQYDGDVAVSY
jgi:hypothetical protein